MNIKYPLAAALLMTSAASFAEPFTLSPLGGGGVLASLNNFSIVPQGPADDSVFTCGNSCTPAQKKQLDAIRQSGYCPQPATKTCTDYVMKLGVCVAANPTETIAAYTPPPDTEWASPTCTRIPCRTKSSPGGDNSTTVDPIVVTASRGNPRRAPAPGDVDFMGPIQNQPAIQPFKDDEAYQAAVKTQQQVTPDAKIIDLGDRRFALLSEDGQTASIGGLCSGGNSCMGMPKPVASIPGLQKKIDEAAQVKGLAENEGTPKGGQTKEEAAVDRPDTNGKAAPISAFNLGAGFGADIASTGGGGFSPNTASGGEVTGTAKAVPWTPEMRAQVLGATTLTYRKSQEMESIINREAERSGAILQGGAVQRQGDPPGRAGTQAVANDGSAQ